MLWAFWSGAAWGALLDAAFHLPIAAADMMWREYALVTLLATLFVALLGVGGLALAQRLAPLRRIATRLEDQAAFWPGLVLGLLPMIALWIPALSPRGFDHRLQFVAWASLVAIAVLPAPWLSRRLGPPRALVAIGGFLAPITLAAVALLPSSLPETVPSPELSAGGSELPPAAGRPDLVLVSIDTLRTDLQREGLPLLPYLLELQAQGRWSAYGLSGANQTVPGHLSMLTGLGMEQHGLGENRHGEQALDGSFPVAGPRKLAEYLHDAGYRTAAVVSNGMLPGRKGWAEGYEAYDDSRADYGDRFFFMRVVGTGGWIEGVLGGRRAQDMLAEWLRITEVELLPPGMAADIVDQALDYHHTLVEGRAPAHLFVHFMDPHSPYTPPASTAGRFEQSTLPPELAPFEHEHHRLINRARAMLRSDDPEAHRIALQGARFLRTLYDEEVLSLDDQLRRLIAGIADSGRPTLVIVTSDHGEYFGEHGMMEHSRMLWEEVLRVPFVVFGLNGVQVPEGEMPAPAQVEDIVPTFLAAAGLSLPKPLRGVDLRGTVPVDRLQVARWSDQLAVRRKGWKLVATVGEGGVMREPQLYDLNHDAAEEHDLAAEEPPEMEGLVAAWQNALLELVKNGGFGHQNLIGAGDEGMLGRLGYTDP